MKPISIKVLLYILPVFFLAVSAFTLSNIQSHKPTKSLASTIISYVPTRLYKSYIAQDGVENTTISGEIYTAESPIPTGALVIVGISAIASGEMTVTDSQGNFYNLITSNDISETARVYIYSSTTTKPLQNGDKIIVGNTKLSALAFSVMPFIGASQVIQSTVMSGNSTDTKTAGIETDKNQVVVSVLGINAKASNVGFIKIAPNVQNCAPVGTDQGNDTSNVYLYLCSYITLNPGIQSVEHSLLKAYPWATVTTTFK
jgi:hypothetical protein